MAKWYEKPQHFINTYTPVGAVRDLAEGREVTPGSLLRQSTNGLFAIPDAIAHEATRDYPNLKPGYRAPTEGEVGYEENEPKVDEVRKIFDELESITNTYGSEVASTTEAYKQMIKALEDPTNPNHPAWKAVYNEYQNRGSEVIADIDARTDRTANQLRQQYTQGAEQAYSDSLRGGQSAANKAALMQTSGLGSSAGGIQKALMESNAMQQAQNESMKYISSIRNANLNNILENENRALDAKDYYTRGGLVAGAGAAQQYYGNELAKAGLLYDADMNKVNSIYNQNVGLNTARLSQHNTNENRKLQYDTLKARQDAAAAAARSSLINSVIGGAATLGGSIIGGPVGGAIANSLTSSPQQTQPQITGVNPDTLSQPNVGTGTDTSNTRGMVAQNSGYKAMGLLSDDSNFDYYENGQKKSKTLPSMYSL